MASAGAVTADAFTNDTLGTQFPPATHNIMESRDSDTQCRCMHSCMDKDVWIEGLIDGWLAGVAIAGNYVQVDTSAEAAIAGNYV